MTAVALDGLVEGDVRTLGRLLRQAEGDAPTLLALARALPPAERPAHVVGVTGPPGAGKSTLTSGLVRHLRAAGRRVAVLAVDPSSTRTGGALLGDRVRMQEHDVDDGVLIRSLASRGHLGGLSAAVPAAIRVVETAGFDTVVLETVGVGQSEIAVVGVADTTLVVLAPGMGDGVQTAKAGLLEVGDVLVAAKADRDGAAALRRDLHTLVRLTGPAAGWTVPVVATSVTGTPGGDGLAELADAVERHRCHLAGSPEGRQRRRARIGEELRALADAERRRRTALGDDDATVARLADGVLRGDVAVVDAVEQLLARDPRP